MKSDAFFRELRAGKSRQLYLFEGEEQFTKERALRELRKAVLNGAFASVNETVLTDPPADELIAVAETLPMMDDRRLVLVRESSLLSAGAGREGAKKTAGLKEGAGGDDRLIAYLDRLPDTVCLVFYLRDKAARTRRLYKKIDAMGGVVSFEKQTEETLVKWIGLELKNAGKEIQRSAAQHLLHVVGTDMTRLQGEIGKLAAYAGERTAVLLEDVEKVCSKNIEYRVFDLTDSLIAGDAGRSVGLMNALLREGEQRLALLALLQRQYRHLLFLRILQEGGAHRSDIARTLGLSPYVVGKLWPAAVQQTVGELLSACELCTDTEYLVKSGQITEEGCLERVVFRLLEGRSHAGNPA